MPSASPFWGTGWKPCRQRHFCRDEETEAQRKEEAYPSSQSKLPAPKREPVLLPSTFISLPIMLEVASAFECTDCRLRPEALWPWTPRLSLGGLVRQRME